MLNTTCSVDRCVNVAHARGWCSMHYSRWHSNSSSMAIPAPPDARYQEIAIDCVHCGQAILTVPNARKFCNADCLTEYHRKPAAVRPSLECIECGTAFIPTGVQKICSDQCRLARERRVDRLRARAEAKQGPKPGDVNNVCDVCGIDFKSRRKRKFCTRQCTSRKQYLDRLAVGWKAPKRPKVLVRCVRCDVEMETRDEQVRFCRSCSCSVAATELHRKQRDRRLPIVHPNPGAATSSDIPRRHPSRRESWRSALKRRDSAKHHNDGWSFFVFGKCVWCDDPFMAKGTNADPDMMPKFCSSSCLRSSSRNRNGRFAVAPQVRLSIYERDEWKCQLCLGDVDPSLGPSHSWAATLDHIECQSWTDTPDHSPENLRLAHRWCNSVRGDGTHHPDFFNEVVS